MTSETASQQEYARWKVERFVRRFEPSYLELACHAALPLVLTAELVSYLRTRFLHGRVPWVAEVDLLLSDLCREAGSELYVMDTAVKAYLMEELRKQFGEVRRREIARLLIHYVRDLARAYPAFGKSGLEAQQWAALVYLDGGPQQVAAELAAALRSNLLAAATREGESGRANLARLTGLAETLAPEIQQFPELIAYARDVRAELGFAPSTTLSVSPNSSSGIIQVGSVVLPGPAAMLRPNLIPVRNRWALLIGINEYHDTALPRFHFCDNDVNALHALLRGQDARLGSFHEPRIFTLLNSAATRTNVLTAMQTICEQAGPDDLLFFHFSGYGIITKGQPALIVYDTTQHDLASTALLLSDLLEFPRRLAYPRIVLSLDAGMPTFIRHAAEVTPDFAFFGTSQEENVALRHGALSSVLLQGLGGAADLDHAGCISINDLHRFVQSVNHSRQTDLSRGKETTDLLSPFSASDPLVSHPGPFGSLVVLDSRSQPTDSSAPLPSGLDILWVDDHPEKHEEVHGILREEGDKITHCSTSEEALRLVAQNRYDAIISDMRRENEDVRRGSDPMAGVHLLTRLRQTGTNTPYLIFTRSRLVTFQSEAQREGALLVTNKAEKLLKQLTQLREHKAIVAMKHPPVIEVRPEEARRQDSELSTDPSFVEGNAILLPVEARRIVREFVTADTHRILIVQGSEEANYHNLVYYLQYLADVVSKSIIYQDFNAHPAIIDDVFEFVKDIAIQCGLNHHEIPGIGNQPPTRWLAKVTDWFRQRLAQSDKVPILIMLNYRDESSSELKLAITCLTTIPTLNMVFLNPSPLDFLPLDPSVVHLALQPITRDDLLEFFSRALKQIANNPVVKSLADRVLLAAEEFSGPKERYLPKLAAQTLAGIFEAESKPHEPEMPYSA